jgi:hypothetical protein
MSKYEVFEALTGEYLGEVDSLHELRLGDGIAGEDGRVFRISSMMQTGPAGKRLRRIEAIETLDTAWAARFDRPAG